MHISTKSSKLNYVCKEFTSVLICIRNQLKEGTCSFPLDIYFHGMHLSTSFLIVDSFTEIYLFLLGFTGFYLLLLGFTGFRHVHFR